MVVGMVVGIVVGIVVWIVVGVMAVVGIVVGVVGMFAVVVLVYLEGHAHVLRVACILLAERQFLLLHLERIAGPNRGGWVAWRWSNGSCLVR